MEGKKNTFSSTILGDWQHNTTCVTTQEKTLVISVLLSQKD